MPAISYHDGQGFIVKKLLGVTSALQLSGASICFLSGTTTQANVEDFFREKEMIFTPVRFDKIDELVKAFDEGKCDTYTADLSQLYAVRLKLANPDDSVVLADVISKEPLGPAVRQGDDQWLNIVRWTLFALINAEELGVTSAGVDELEGREQVATRAGGCWAPKAASGPTWVSIQTGRSAPSRRRETMARSSTAIWARTRRLPSSAASMPCGMPAGCSTRRRCVRPQVSPWALPD